MVVDTKSYSVYYPNSGSSGQTLAMNGIPTIEVSRICGVLIHFIFAIIYLPYINITRIYIASFSNVRYHINVFDNDLGRVNYLDWSKAICLCCNVSGPHI